jgi:peroxiredoxin
MNDILFTISYITLWMFVLVIASAMFFLYRFHGLIYTNSREGRANQGLELKERAPSITLQDIKGTMYDLDSTTAQYQLLLFGSHNCKTCLKVKFSFAAFAEKYRGIVKVYLICKGSNDQVASFAQGLPDNIRIIPDPGWKIGARFRVVNLPFAILLDHNNIIQLKLMPASFDDFDTFIQNQHLETHQIIAARA